MNADIKDLLEQSETRIEHAIKYDWEGGFEPQFYHRWLKRELEERFSVEITSTIPAQAEEELK